MENLTFEQLDNIKTEDVFNYIELQGYYYDLYPGYSKEEREYKDYYYNSRKDAYKEANSILKLFDSFPNPFPIYRTIGVDSESKINKKYLGRHWSFNEISTYDFAKANLSEFDQIWLISAKTTKDNVDWKETIKLFFQFSKFGNVDPENEILIKKDSIITDSFFERIK